MQRFFIFISVLAALPVVHPGLAAELPQLTHPSVRVTAPIDDSQLKVLRGNTHPLANARFDQGAAPSDLPMNRMLLVLTRSTQQESALQALLAAQQDKSSPLYHRWLTPQDFGQQFGVADQDIQTVTAWLESYGFQVDRISNGRSVIEFSGTAGQVQQAFHTEIHKYVVNGQEHWANTSDPQVPAALGPVLAGIVTLHNFGKKPQLTATGRQVEAIYQPGAQPQFTASDGSHELVPADYAVIYNINPLYSAGTNGSGTTVAVVARTDIKMSDVNQFRSTFGLSNNPPQTIVNGPDPGDLGGSEEAEAVLDTTWAGAVARGATIKLVVSKSTNSTDGVDLSEEYIIDNNLGDVMTESFGDCEANYTAAEGAFYSSLAQQAASEGITYTVAAGDSGAEGCDDPNSASATGPISPSVLASTPYDIAVGGTEFNEGSNASQYWSATNGTNDQSALSYIPEITWNESCTSTTCTNGNTPGLWAGGGGASTFFSKPSWQSGVPGIPADGVRDTPDVSLTAAGHDAYLLCLDSSCTPDRRGRIYFDGYSGTSAATPSFAGIMALVVQKYGRQGQANYVLYPLAAAENLSQCNGSNQSGLPASTCIFNDVTSGNNAVPGEAGYGTPTADFQAIVGYDLATGLGSVNVANLVNQWNSASSLLPVVQVNVDNPGSANSVVAGTITFSGWALYNLEPISSISIAVDNVPVGNATPGTLARADVCQAFPGGVGCPNVGWSFNFDTTTLPNGTHTVQATATASDGQARTVSSFPFTVANWSTANPMIAVIDTPGANGTSFSGTVGFSGWAIDNLSQIAEVLVSIDGVSYGTATYGGSRPDVCNAYPNRAGCPNVGWNFTLDTTLLPDGQHPLAITPITYVGQSSTWTAPFTVNNSSADPFQLDIDQPNSHSGAFSGPASFSGWAVSSLGAVTSVAVTIDGLGYGNATYGVNRPDVCTALPGRAGCPNVGWTSVLDTTQLANGTHLFAITAYLSSGQHATVSSSFTVSNVTIGLPIKMIIDNPNGQNSVLFGSTTFSGWAIDDNGPITNVQISIDGASRGNATYGSPNSPRPDVCITFPGRAGCPYVEWSYPINTTLIPDGPHTVDVTATSSTGDKLTLSTPITVANWTSGNPMKLVIDVPGTQTATSLSGPSATISGWAISDIASVAYVSISVDGVPMGNATYGTTRNDVCAAYPGRAGCPNVGWNFPLNTTHLADGPHTLQVTATSSGWQSTTVTSTFTVSNGAGNPNVIVIDQPSANSTLTDTATLSGWALNTNSGVSIAGVVILVDGVSYGSASSTYRPDVCAAYVNAGGCPNVGWTFSLNTSLLANGSHTLQVRTTASNGQQATISRPINITNLR